MGTLTEIAVTALGRVISGNTAT